MMIDWIKSKWERYRDEKRQKRARGEWREQENKREKDRGRKERESYKDIEIERSLSGIPSVSILYLKWLPPKRGLTLLQIKYSWILKHYEI